MIFASIFQPKTTSCFLNDDHWNQGKTCVSKWVMRLTLCLLLLIIDMNCYLCLGGSVSTPLSKTENELITQLSEEFVVACDAEAQSGKTTWIGIVRDEGGKWAVSMTNRHGMLWHSMN